MIPIFENTFNIILLCSVSPEGEETRPETVGRPWHVWSTWFVRHIHVRDHKLITFYGDASTIYNHTTHTHTHTEKIHAIIYSRWWVRNWSKCQSKRTSYSCKVIEFMYTCAGLVPRFRRPPQSVQNRNKRSVGWGTRGRWEEEVKGDRACSRRWPLTWPLCLLAHEHTFLCFSRPFHGDLLFRNWRRRMRFFFQLSSQNLSSVSCK